MDSQYIFNFKTDISGLEVPDQLNNPFELGTSKIAELAAKEFQAFISLESHSWAYAFSPQNTIAQKGKMFGILVVQNQDGGFFYLGTNSGKLPGNALCKAFVPTVFDESTDDFFINKGMTELTVLCNKINASNNQSEIVELKEKRRLKSFGLQQRLFENYHFLNILGTEKNVQQIFKDASQGKPPAAAGECAAPKLLHYALKHGLKPIALAEFWWGATSSNKERTHKVFYPACQSKCRPILEFMLDDPELFNQAS